MVIELVLLKLKSGVQAETFLPAAEVATEFLKSCQGFKRRRLAKGEDERWVDYLEWETMGDALVGAEQFDRAPATKLFREAIDATSVITRRLAVQAFAN